MLRAWAKSLGKGNINKDKYWRKVGDRNWCFSTENGIELAQHAKTPIIRHIKVKGIASPFDGNWIYWSERRGEYPGTTRVATLLEKQQGICNHCWLSFTSEDLIEVDRIIPKVLGGKDVYSNLQLLHKHCHDTKSSIDGSNSKTAKAEYAKRLKKTKSEKTKATTGYDDWQDARKASTKALDAARGFD
jgi:RNA-directed DNA polymerase